MTILILRNSIGRSPLRPGFLLIPVVLACFALSQTARAQLPSPTPDGGYPGYNTAEGDKALYYLTTGVNNTAIGFEAISDNTSGSDNTANGYQALYTNTTGYQNTANGSGALSSNTTGFNNTAIGYEALDSNTTGEANTAEGYEALYFNTSGLENTANGNYALYHNTTGHDNTADGQEALLGNTTGSSNIALGVNAGAALTTGNFNIDIGSSGSAGEANTIRIGNSNQTATFIAGIYGVNENGIPLAVYINSNGQLGTLSSSRRFKKEIKPMDQTSQSILGLQPVTFQYKSDASGTAQFGLIAEEVEKVNPDLIVRDADGKPYSVRYEAVNAMLLNEFLKEHRTVQELKSTAAKQEATIARQQKQIEALTTGLQKVSDQLELSKPVPQMASNDR
jgi:endosialidase-like protein